MSRAKSEARAIAPAERVKYFRMVELPLKPGDTFRGYQAEQIEIEGDVIISKEMVDKPNLFEYIQNSVTDLIDPRNHVKPAPASDFV